MTKIDFKKKSPLMIFLTYFKNHKKLFAIDISCAVGIAAIAGAVLLAKTDFTALATAPGEQSHEAYEDND